MHRRHRGLRFEWLRGRIFSMLVSGKTIVAIRRKEAGLILRFHPPFSHHGIAQILSALGELIWLHEKVGFHPTFSRHGIAQSLSALALLIWLHEKVPSRTSKWLCTDAKIFPALVKILTERELSVKEIIFIGQPFLKANHSPTHERILLAPADKDMMTLALRPPSYMDRPLLADSR